MTSEVVESSMRINKLAYLSGIINTYYLEMMTMYGFNRFLVTQTKLKFINIVILPFMSPYMELSASNS